MELLFLNVLLAGAGLLLWVFIRALPRLDRAETLKRSLVDRWLVSELPQRLNVFVHAVWLRVLRRMKVVILKLDHDISRKLQRMKPEREAGPVVAETETGFIKAPVKPLEKRLTPVDGIGGKGEHTAIE